MLELIETFVAVYDAKNFTKASQRLYLSQSAVSNQISSLEEMLGVTLFERIKYVQVFPTAEAQFFYNECKQLQNEWKSIVKTLKQLERETCQPIVIGASETIGNTMISPLLIKLEEVFPQNKFEFYIASSSEIIKSIHLSKTHIGLVESNISDTALESKVFMHDEMLVVGEEKEDIWLFHNGEESTEQYVNQYLAYTRTKPKTVIKFNNQSTILKIIEQGIGQAIISSLLVLDSHHILDRTNIFRPLHMIFDNSNKIVDFRIKNTLFLLLTSNKSEYTYA
ncbi:LysR family transcriptional regulator [Listeria grandensis]|uniref:LysR family transcriptional regulator n=1 Tax=Listeria grandensis TaxID=1494963 RepID=A0A7X1CR97_9LIST|nr:LysR family transcriptional regulator [Listeria grandensis]MBC1474455.1 LysR family transcriptional regulator [Listeria grandensis]MBC1937837.1 LysR family transcriptional regulator [Listeria grandensis]